MTIGFTLRHARPARAVLNAVPVAAKHHLPLARFTVMRAIGDPFEVLRHAVDAGPLIDEVSLAGARLAAGRAAYGCGEALSRWTWPGSRAAPADRAPLSQRFERDRPIGVPTVGISPDAQPPGRQVFHHRTEVARRAMKPVDGAFGPELVRPRRCNTRPRSAIYMSEVRRSTRWVILPASQHAVIE